MAEGRLSSAATMAGDINGAMQRCRSLRPTEDGKAIMTVPVLLYDGVDKHLTSDPAKFKRAIRIYEDAFGKATRRTDSCQAEKARYPRLYR